MAFGDLVPRPGPVKAVVIANLHLSTLRGSGPKPFALLTVADYALATGTRGLKCSHVFAGQSRASKGGTLHEIVSI